MPKTQTNKIERGRRRGGGSRITVWKLPAAARKLAVAAAEPIAVAAAVPIDAVAVPVAKASAPLAVPLALAVAVVGARRVARHEAACSGVRLEPTRRPFSAWLCSHGAATLAQPARVRVARLCVGVDFIINNGRVSAMRRKDGKGGKPVGEWYTVPREVSLEKTLKELAQFRMAQEGLLR